MPMLDFEQNTSNNNNSVVSTPVTSIVNVTDSIYHHVGIQRHHHPEFYETPTNPLRISSSSSDGNSNNARSSTMMMMMMNANNNNNPQVYSALRIRSQLQEIAKQQQQQQHHVPVMNYKQQRSPTIMEKSPFMLLIGAARAIEEMQIDVKNPNLDYSRDQKLKLHRAMSQSSISSSWYGSGSSSASTSPRATNMSMMMMVSSPSSGDQDSSNEDDSSSVGGGDNNHDDEDFLLGGGYSHSGRSGNKKRSMSEGGSGTAVRKHREPHVEAKKDEWRRMSPQEKQSHIRLALAAANDGSQSARQIAISMGIPYTVLQRVRNGKVPLNRVGTQGPRPTDEQESPSQPKRRKSL